MCWFFKKKKVPQNYETSPVEEKPEIKVEEKPSKRTVIVSITIYYANNTQYGYTQEYENSKLENISAIKSFYDFFNWFHNKESPYYTFYHKQGCDVFVRNQIISFSIKKYYKGLKNEL